MIRKLRTRHFVIDLRNRLKGILLFISLFYLTVYLPFTFTVYVPLWYQLNCRWHSRCEEIGHERAQTGIHELTSFLRHQGELVSISWTRKEKFHLAQARDIIDRLFLVALSATVMLLLTFDRGFVPRKALVNAAVIICFLAILPIFEPFWKQFFHPLLFNNELWKNTPFDLSYYIMPDQFFKVSMTFVIAMSCLINLTIWFALRNRNNSKSHRDDDR